MDRSHYGLARSIDDSRRADRLCDTEVRYLAHAVLVDEDVVRLDVPVHDAVLVGCGKTGSDLLRIVNNCIIVKRRSLLDEAAQRHALNELHDYIVDISFFSDVIYADYVRMRKARSRVRFLSEIVYEFVIVSIFGLQDLHGYRSVEETVLRLVNDSHSAVADLFEKLVSSYDHFTAHLQPPFDY